MHMAKDNGQFNEYITKRELKRRFHIIDKHIARYFPEPVFQGVPGATVNLTSAKF